MTTLDKCANIFRDLIARASQNVPQAVEEGYATTLSTTNIYHLRYRFADWIRQRYSKAAADLAREAVEGSIKCYAGKLHLNRGRNLARPGNRSNEGYAPTFEQLKSFPGRMAQAARWRDLSGQPRTAKPWLDQLPRLIFVSDMGDAFSDPEFFPFLEQEAQSIGGPEGRRHLWLWLSKRAHIMRQFGSEMGAFPPNVCAMTTVTSRANLSRVDQLRCVPAAMRGLSLEPLWESVAESLDLDGIDWVIVGGESGAQHLVRPFPLEWVRDLHARCQAEGVAFFLKQLGRKPTENLR